MGSSHPYRAAALKAIVAACYSYDYSFQLGSVYSLGKPLDRNGSDSQCYGARGSSRNVAPRCSHVDPRLSCSSYC